VSAVADRAVNDRVLNSFDATLGGRLEAPDGIRAAEPADSVVDWACALLRDAISARSVFVFDADCGDKPRLIGAPACGRSGDDAVPETETMLELLRSLRDGSPAGSISEREDLEAAPYNVIPLRAGRRVLGLLVITKRQIESADWPVIADYAGGVTRCLLAEADQKRREQELVDRRRALVREIHDTVIQDLFGIALALDDPAPGTAGELAERGASIRAVQQQLRSILDRATHDEWMTDSASPTLPKLEALLREQARNVPLALELEALAGVPAHVAGIAARCVSEGLRNALKHADPTSVSIIASLESNVIRVSVSNDGVRRADARPGIGLRLLELDALSLGGSVSAIEQEGTWELMLSMPTARI